MKFSAKHMHHTAINVADMERSIKFYRDVLGFKPLFPPQDASGDELSKAVKLEGAHLRYLMMKVGQGPEKIELIQYLSPIGKPYDRLNCDTGNTHIAFRVDDIEQAFEELSKKGVKFNGEPIHIGSGPLKGNSFVYFTDPDGVTLELFEE